MQLYVVGELVGLTGVSDSAAAGAHCKWSVVASNHWEHVSGADSGASQGDSPAEGNSMFVFQHPIDVCYETSADDATVAGMPHIEIEVRWLDSYGRSDLGGYAVVHVPAAPGMHELSCRVWRPKGSMGDRIASFFVGGNPQLRDAKMRYGREQPGDGDIGTRLTRSAGGQRMSTTPSGEVHLRLSVCRKGAEATGGGASG